ncbi:MAG: hypothetical protein C5B52_11165 [Bacteroidetes bacterium]|nr:MAG: hypothetical protein C5B52_11165 [Bacteroidota bacterium]
MKRLIFASIVGSMLALAMVGNANAQNTNDVTLESVKYLQASLAISQAGMLEKANLNYSADAHSKAIKDFKRSFKSATDERWSPVADGYIATFTKDGIKTAVAYNKKGNWDHTIRFYGDNELNADVKSIVMKEHYASKISQVEEIEMNDKTVFLVHLEGSNGRKLVRVCDGEMETLVSAAKN